MTVGAVCHSIGVTIHMTKRDDVPGDQGWRDFLAMPCNVGPGRESSGCRRLLLSP